jgi:hypothetical protein
VHETEPKPSKNQQISAYKVNSEEISSNDEEKTQKNNITAIKKQPKTTRRRTSNSQTPIDDSKQLNTRLKTQKSLDNIQTNNFASLNKQIVPIQTFSFFKWNINVDTLVRLFIVAYVLFLICHLVYIF